MKKETKEKQREKISYRVRGFRLNDDTYEKLKAKRNGVSWNKFLLSLLDKKK